MALGTCSLVCSVFQHHTVTWAHRVKSIRSRETLVGGHSLVVRRHKMGTQIGSPCDRFLKATTPSWKSRARSYKEACEYVGSLGSGHSGEGSVEKVLCAGEHRHGEVVTHREAEYQYPSHSSLALRFLSSPITGQGLGTRRPRIRCTPYSMSRYMWPCRRLSSPLSQVSVHIAIYQAVFPSPIPSDCL